MRTLGLLGGMSWESTVLYYQQINRRVRQQLGKLHSSKCIVYSFDFEEIEEGQREGDWKQLESKLCDAARGLKLAGAEGIVICTNTMHKLATSIERDTQLPVLHIASFTGKAIVAAGYSSWMRIIYSELCNGVIRAESRKAYVETIHRLIGAGAECIILGCTEIGLLITSADVCLPIFDTTMIHAQGVATGR